MTFAHGQAGAQFQLTPLLGRQCRPSPLVVLMTGQNVPGNHRQLARGCNGGDLLTASTADAKEEGA